MDKHTTRAKQAKRTGSIPVKQPMSFTVQAAIDRAKSQKSGRMGNQSEKEKDAKTKMTTAVVGTLAL